MSIWLLCEDGRGLLEVGARLPYIACAAQQLALVNERDGLPVQIVDLELCGERLLVIVRALREIAEPPIQHTKLTANQRFVATCHDACRWHNRHIQADERIPRAPLHQVVVQLCDRKEVISLLPLPAQA